MTERDIPGAILREKREAKKLTLEEVSNRTKIHPRYLKALEEGNLSVFPGEIYLKGFLRNYARLLDLDPEGLLSQYKESEIIEQFTEPTKSRMDRFDWFKQEGKRLFGRIRERRLMVLKWLKEMAKNPSFYIGLSILVLFFFFRWFFSSETMIPEMESFKSRSLTQEKEAPKRGDDQLAAISERKLVQKEPTKERKGLHLEAEAIEEVWIQITKDSGEPKEALLRPGQRLSWRATREIKIRVGNAGGLNLWLNGDRLPPLGGSGEVVTKTFTLKGPEQENESSQ